MKKFFKEFGEFISKGNVFDMAVGLIIATAFNKIVSSLVNDMIMPLITWATGAASIADLSVVLKVAEDGTKLTWKYGNFFQVVIDFLIIAISVFIMVKIVNASRKKIKEFGENFSQEEIELRKKKHSIKKQAKKEGKSFDEMWNSYLIERQTKLDEEKRIATEEAERKAKEEEQNNPSEKALLKEIRDLLKEKE